MAVVVNFQKLGVEVSNTNKLKSIFLLSDAWQNLNECKKEVERSLEKKTELQWKIDNDKDIRVHTNIFKDKSYVHIRHWYQERPTKQGVSFLQEEWNELKTHLQEDRETSLGIKVMTQMLKGLVSDIMRNDCEGCHNDWPSQRDHDCLMNGAVNAGICIDRAHFDIKKQVPDFIVLLSQEAFKEKLILERPHQTFKRVAQFHIGSIKKAVLDTYVV